MTHFGSRLFVALQHLLPQHGLSRLVGWFARCRARWIAQPLIRLFIRAFAVDMTEAQQSSPAAYGCFNEFFVRSLRPDARQFVPAPAIACPADGAVSEIGAIDGDRILQAKGEHYSLRSLLGGNGDVADRFAGGSFAAIYLSPRDYHRVHMPLAGELREMTCVPGRLFSVNEASAQLIPGLFARNERMVALFDTELGPMALVMVGAMIVAGIETVWAETVTPCTGAVRRTLYGNGGEQSTRLAHGDEMGRFKLGSTVIVLFEKDRVRWNPALNAGANVRLGQSLADPVRPDQTETPAANAGP